MRQPIRLYGDSCLKEKAFNVEEGDNVIDLVNDLLDTLDASGSGVGLAATQIGVPLRVFVMDYNDKRISFINPVINSTGDSKSKDAEGCLSIPNVSVDIERYDDINVSYQTIEDGKIVQKTEDFYDYHARIIQHEIDHLDGISITDKISTLRKKMIQSKLDKILKGGVEYSYLTIHTKSSNYKVFDDWIYSIYIKEEEE